MTVNNIRKHAGFTFVELIITLAIMGVLVSVAIPLSQVAVQRDKEQELRASLIQIRSALDAYKRAVDQGRIKTQIGESGYPKELDELVDGVLDQRSPSKQNIYILRSLPRDPMSADASLPASETWQLRSYDSPPDNPSEGEDIFDVYSKSDKLGLNGVAYSQW